jgi:hypothetical protein
MPLVNLLSHTLSIFLVTLAAFLKQLGTMARAPQMPLEILPPAVWLERARRMRTPVRPQRLMCTLVFAQITAVCARKVAEAAGVRFLAVV